MKILLFFFISILPALSMAESTIYGQISTGFHISQSQSNQFGQHHHRGIANHNSYIGLRGKHALGNDNRLTWQMGQTLSPSYNGSSREYIRHRKEQSLFAPR